MKGTLFIATTGTAAIATALTLPALRNKLQARWSEGEAEDAAVWRVDEQGDAHAVLLLCTDGRQFELDGYSLTWRFPPTIDPKPEA